MHSANCILLAVKGSAKENLNIYIMELKLLASIFSDLFSVLYLER